MSSNKIELLKQQLNQLGFANFDSYTTGLAKTSKKEPDALVNKVYEVFELSTPEILRAKNPYHFQQLISKVKSQKSESINDKIQKFWIELHASQLTNLSEFEEEFTVLVKEAKESFLESFQNISWLVEQETRERLKLQEGGTYTPYQASFSFDQLGIYWLRTFYAAHYKIGLTKFQRLFAEANIFWCYCTEHSFIYCPHPNRMELDENNKLHAENRAAIRWSDDFEIYAWRGIKVAKSLITNPEEITKTDILLETNAEKRRIIQEKLGSEKFGFLLGLEELDKDVDLQGNMQYLYKTKEVDNIAKDYLYFAKVSCPSTGRIYFLGVPPGLSNVWDAVAWTFGKDKESYRPLIET